MDTGLRGAVILISSAFQPRGDAKLRVKVAADSRKLRNAQPCYKPDLHGSLDRNREGFCLKFSREADAVLDRSLNAQRHMTFMNARNLSCQLYIVCDRESSDTRYFPIEKLNIVYITDTSCRQKVTLDFKSRGNITG